MADKNPNLFQKLTRLFRSGPVVKRNVLRRTTDSKTSTAFETFRKNQSQVYSAAMSAYGTYDRMARYSDFSEMEYTPEIASALDIYAEESVAADENEVMSVGIAYAAGNMSMSARQEFNGDDETEFSVSYTEGALTFGAAYDSGQGTTAHYGSEAQLVLNASYTDGDVTVAAQGNDQDEMEVSISFAF